VREGTETDGCDGWMNGVGVELAQGFFWLVADWTVCGVARECGLS